MKASLPLLLLGLCASAAAQPAKPPRFNPAARQLPPAITATAVTPALKMPDVAWLEVDQAAAQIERALHRGPRVIGEGVVMSQIPPAGEAVDPKAIVQIDLGLPRVTLTASNQSPSPNEPVTFKVALDPPPPSTVKVEYRFVFDDKRTEEWTAEPETTRSFTTTMSDVVAQVRINGRWTAWSFPLAFALPNLRVPPPLQTMPNVLWLERDQAIAQLSGILRQPPRIEGEGVVIRQEPQFALEVTPETAVTLTLGVPRPTLVAFDTGARINQDVAFALKFDPPPAAFAKVDYRFAFDGQPFGAWLQREEVTHRFGEARAYRVAAEARINGRWIARANDVTVDIVGEPSVTTGPIAPSPSPAPAPIRWQPWAIAIGAVLALGAMASVVVRKPPSPKVAPPQVTVRSGLRASDHTVERPEQVRKGLTVRLRGGLRTVVANEGGSDA